MKISRGFLFTLEAFLTLLAALALSALFYSMSAQPRISGVGASAFVQDVAHLTVRTQLPLLQGAARGDAAAVKRLQSLLGSWVRAWPAGTCAGISFDSGMALSTCPQTSGTSFSASALFWDGSTFSGARFWLAMPSTAPFR